MIDYQPNSHKSKETSKAPTTEKKVQKVVTKPVKTKKNTTRKFADVFISEDAANVKSYILFDVLVPSIKKAFSEIVKDGVDMILYGKSGAKKNNSTGYVSYSKYYGDSKPAPSQSGSSRFFYEDVVFQSRGEAEAVYEQMQDIIETYGFVTVADLYDMVDLTPPYTANKYGWTNLRNSDVVRIRDGWIVKLPKAMPID